MSDDQARTAPEPVSDAGAIETQVLELRAELRRREVEIERLESMLTSQQRALARMQDSFAWQLISRFWHARDRVLARSAVLRLVYDRGFGSVKKVLRRGSRERGSLDGVPGSTPAQAYARWLSLNTPSSEDLGAMRAEASRLLRRPLFSVVATVREIDEPRLRRCIALVQAQVWDRWELVLIDGGSEDKHVQRALAEAPAADPRIRIDRRLDGGTSGALALAQGEFVLFLDPRDELAPEALYEVALAVEARPDVDLVYSDADRIDEAGQRAEPFFKPDWSPDLLLSMNYVSRLAVYRRSLLQEVMGPRCDVSQDYDLVLRFTERARQVLHVAKVLYHSRRVEGPGAVVSRSGEDAAEADRRALQDALARRGVDAKVERTRLPVYRVRYALKGAPLVSIIMPTKDKPAVLRACVESVEARSTWASRELLIVDNGTTAREGVRYLRELERRHRVLRDPRPFNWSALNNAAVRDARGQYLLFMNNDMEVITPDWIEALLEHAQRAEVGAVGARLLYPNRKLQHAGVILGQLGVASHAFKHLPEEDPSYECLAHAVRNVSAVTGACLMVRREVFDHVGGFDERLSVAFNDVDFCLRLRAAGYLVVYTPFATLFHYESETRGSLHPPEDEALMRVRWQKELLADPYYSPHLTRDREDYSIAT